MSALPEIDQAIVLKKVVAKAASNYSELFVQIAQLETLAEALRDERDAAQTELAELKNKNGAPLEGTVVP